jgi:hypothetical protein
MKVKLNLRPSKLGIRVDKEDSITPKIWIKLPFLIIQMSLGVELNLNSQISIMTGSASCKEGKKGYKKPLLIIIKDLLCK